MSIKFKNPPLNELVIGVYFEREVSSLRAEHVGLFWGQNRGEFPRIYQQLPVNPPNFDVTVAPPMILEFNPMPRLWLEDATGATLLQIQKNAFLVNWRKRDSAYPHFEVVKASFEKNKGKFFRFLLEEIGESAPKAQLAELSYINVIEPCEYWRGPRETKEVVPLFSVPVPDSGDVSAPDFNQVTSQRLAADLNLTTAVRTGRSPQDLSKPVLVIEYRAIGPLLDGTDADGWFARAHDAINNCFTKMTSPDIQKTYWQPV